MLKLYKTFVLPHFRYCSLVWHFCSFRNSEKLESLNKRALRVVFNPKTGTILKDSSDAVVSLRDKSVVTLV